MKAIYGLLLVGVSALALGGCSTSDGGPAAFANALLGSATTNVDEGYAVSEASDAATDQRTTAKLEINDPNDDWSDGATLTATVTNGDQVQGPTEYAYSNQNEGEPVSPLDTAYAAFYRFDPTSAPQHPETGADNSILFAGAGMYSYAALVAGNDPEKGEAAAVNTAGFFAGDAPTDLPTANEDVYYAGSAIAGMATTDGTGYGGGDLEMSANFGTGKVKGDIDFGDYGGIGFAGDMSTSHATYSASSGVAGQALTLYQVVDETKYSSSAFGQVVGGFFGPGGVETAGTFAVQDHAGAIGTDLDPSTLKITGSFGGTVVLP